ncbi:MAG: TonB-dependent receptor plug domain-containing protein, partial [Opitutaceae bacterium]|nr:TonB-dependent receptor plug domain-containing protein [Opitutaceae bacterium]
TPRAGAESESNPTLLSPFEVTTSKDVGYAASNTLAGTRLNSELWETPAAISVFTKEFMEDAGLLSMRDALDYALNSSEEYTDYTGQANLANDITAQIRGFVGGAVGRNYFQWRLVNIDRFNLERIDLSRGPNSVLFGIGAPGGIINASTKRARFGRDINEIGGRYGSWSDHRAELDLGRTLLKNRLDARLNLVAQDRGDWREFKHYRLYGGALALTYRPFNHTEIRVEGEYGDVDQIIAQPWPAGETYLGWYNNPQNWTDPTNPASPRRMPSAAAAPYGYSPGAPATALAAVGRSTGVNYIWDPFAGTGPVTWNGSAVTNGGERAPALNNVRASIIDESIMPLNASIHGPGFTRDYHYHNLSAFIEQRIGANLAFEAAFNQQAVSDFHYRVMTFGAHALAMDLNRFRPTASNSVGIVTASESNPNFGKFYAQTAGNMAVTERKTDDYRLTGSYRLDLTKHRSWLGRHEIAALLSRTNVYTFDDAFASQNVTPVGNAQYPLDLTSGNNQILRRVYIDFANPDPRWHGLFDPLRYPLTGQNGVTEGYVRTGDSARDNLSQLDTGMTVLQSRWLNNSVILTGGYRHDRRRIWNDTADFNGNGTTTDEREPVTRLYPRRIRSNVKQFAQGDTRTFGAVVSPFGWKWLALVYNKSDSFQPQAALDINDQALGNRRGDGTDYGVRMRLWDNKLNVAISRYELSDTNQSVGRDNNFINFINAIWETLNNGVSDQNRGTASRDGQSLKGEGWELEVTANPTRNWRLRLNAARTMQVASALQPANGAYLEANRALWMQNATMVIPDPIRAKYSGLPGGETVAGTLARVDAIYNLIQAGAGQTRRQLREYTGNVFTTYTFRDASAGWLRNLTVGGGARYYGDGVLGYDSARNNRPIVGGGYTLASAMMGRGWTLKKGRQLRLQLNVDNVLNETDPIVTDMDQTEEYRVVLQTPRRFGLSANLTF